MKIKSNKLQLAIFAALAAQTPMLTNSAMAQPALEEIVITSTRRETNVQDVPVSVTAITGDDLQTQNIENVQDLTAAIPNVVIRGGNQGSQTASINMRGIPNVGVYVDDVWQVSGSGLLQRQFVDLDRIEVLRGPQGTLNGRDSTGGSIHIFTKKPDEEFGAVVNIGIGDFDRRDVSASVDVPITDTLFSKWTVASYDKDGYIHSINTGQNFGALENDVMVGDLYWTPTDRLSARLTYTEDNQTSTTARVQTHIDHTVPQQEFGWQIGLAEAYHIGSLAAGGPGFDVASTVSGAPGGRVGQWETTAVQSSPTVVETEQITFSLNYDLTDTLSLKYVYGDTTNLSDRYVDYAGSEFNFFAEIDLEKTKLKSHEFQISGEFDRMHWNAGYYTWEQEFKQRIVEWSNTDWTFTEQFGDNGDLRALDYDDVLASDACTTRTPSDIGLEYPGDTWPGLPCTIPGAVPYGGPGVFAIGRNSTNGFDGSDSGRIAEEEGHAIFGEFTYDISDQWDVTVGARYHEQDNSSYRATVSESKLAGTTELRPILLDTTFHDASFALASPKDTDPITQDLASFDNTSFRFATSYDIRDGIMAYFAYTEGFNAGGVSRYTENERVADGGILYPAMDIGYSWNPEQIENLEIGLRGDFFDGRLRANVTYFHTSWNEIQLATSVFHSRTIEVVALTETTTQNAADGLAKGFEFELTYAATDDLLLGANLGFLDTGFTAVLPGAGSTTIDTEFGGAPDETYNLWGTYDWNLSGGANLMARFEANYTGKYWRSSNPSYRQDFYGGPGQAGDTWKLNGRIIFTPASANYELSLWGNNLTNEVILNSGFMDNIWGFDFAGIDAPREIGLSLKMQF